MNPLVASALVVLSAAGFGAMAIFARYAYADGVDVYGVLMPRFVIAAAVLWWLLRLRGERLPPARRWPGLALMGLGYVAQSFCFFTALRYIPAGMVALLLYLYPIFVVLLAWLLGQEALTPRKLVALTVCSVGTALTLGLGDLGSSALDPRGVALAVGAALVYSVYIVGGSRATRGLEPMASTTVILASAAAGLVVIVAVRFALGEPARFAHSVSGWAAVLAIALVSTVLAVGLFVVGLKHLGASRTALISTLEPVLTMLLAALFLAERLAPAQFVGGALVLAGALLLAFAPASASSGRTARA